LIYFLNSFIVFLQPLCAEGKAREQSQKIPRDDWSADAPPPSKRTSQSRLENIVSVAQNLQARLQKESKHLYADERGDASLFLTIF